MNKPQIQDVPGLTNLLEGMGVVLQDLRLKAGLRQRDAAKVFKGSQATICYAENGKIDMNFSTLVRLAAIYDHEVEISFKPKEEKKSDEWEDAWADALASLG